MILSRIVLLNEMINKTIERYLFQYSHGRRECDRRLVRIHTIHLGHPQDSASRILQAPPLMNAIQLGYGNRQKYENGSNPDSDRMNLKSEHKPQMLNLTSPYGLSKEHLINQRPRSPFHGPHKVKTLGHVYVPNYS